MKWVTCMSSFLGPRPTLRWLSIHRIFHLHSIQLLLRTPSCLQLFNQMRRTDALSLYIALHGANFHLLMRISTWKDKIHFGGNDFRCIVVWRLGFTIPILGYQNIFRFKCSSFLSNVHGRCSKRIFWIFLKWAKSICVCRLRLIDSRDCNLLHKYKENSENSSKNIRRYVDNICEVFKTVWIYFGFWII